MTLETMNAVIASLIAKGIPARLEYPGYIAIETSDRTYAFGCANPMFILDIVNSSWDTVASIESDIPSDSNDVARITEWMTQQLQQLLMKGNPNE